MNIAGDSIVKTAPRISEAQFTRVLERAGSPWANAAHTFYALIAGSGHDPAFWLAICGREHTFATNPDSVLVIDGTNSWTNARTLRVPAALLSGPVKIITSKKNGTRYVRYASVPDSLIDGMFRIDDPSYVYQQQGRVTIAGVLGLWTEAEAGAYTAYVVDAMNQWIAEDSGMATPDPFSILPYARDARADLATSTAPGHGPTERVAWSKKRGVVVHYRGEVTAASAGLSSLEADARYHVGKNWCKPGQEPCYGSGIMYHIGIDGAGTVWLMRDLDRVLWHCGAWPENEISTAIQLPLGPGQHPTPAQLASLARVVNDLCRATNTPRSLVKGHMELMSTDCPDRLMDDFVRPFRAGAFPDAGSAPPVDEAEAGWAPDDNTYGTFFWRRGFYNEVKNLGGAKYPPDWKLGALAHFGYPKEDEWEAVDGNVYQRCERRVLQYQPGAAAPWDVIGTILPEVTLPAPKPKG